MNTLVKNSQNISEHSNHFFKKPFKKLFISAEGGGAGAYSGEAVRGAPTPPSDFGGASTPLNFQNLKRKSTVTHQSNGKRDKEEEGKRRITFCEVMMAKETTPSPLFPPIYISVSPFLPFK